MNADEIEDKEIEEFLNFMQVANDSCKERGKIYEFECPICKGKAKVSKASVNGHIHARCEKCDMKVIQ